MGLNRLLGFSFLLSFKVLLIITYAESGQNEVHNSAQNIYKSGK